jgi:hypothetical protein
MSTAVWPVKCYYPLKHTLKKIVLIQSLGDMNEQRVSKNQSYGPRANGLGGQSGYKGQNIFTVSVKQMQHLNNDPTQTANILWNFYQNIADGSLNSFYFYNPAENAGDPGASPLNLGVDVLGRYLVRFQDNTLDFDLFVRYLYNTGVTLMEVRS